MERPQGCRLPPGAASCPVPSTWTGVEGHLHEGRGASWNLRWLRPSWRTRGVQGWLRWQQAEGKVGWEQQGAIVGC